MRDQLIEAGQTNHRINLFFIDRAKDLADGLERFEWKYSPTKQELVEALTESAEAISVFLANVLDGRERRCGFRKGVFTILVQDHNPKTEPCPANRS